MSWSPELVLDTGLLQLGRQILLGVTLTCVKDLPYRDTFSLGNVVFVLGHLVGPFLPYNSCSQAMAVWLLPISCLPNYLCGNRDAIIDHSSAARQCSVDLLRPGYCRFLGLCIGNVEGWMLTPYPLGLTCLSYPKRDSYFKSQELTGPQTDPDLMEKPKHSEPLLGDGPEERRKCWMIAVNLDWQCFLTPFKYSWRDFYTFHNPALS